MNIRKKNESQNYLKRLSLLLLPGLVQGILSYSIIPFSTRILNADDFGKFALFNTITATTAIVICAGGNFLVNNSYEGKIINSKNKVLISTITFVNLISFFIISSIYVFLFLLIRNNVDFIQNIPLYYILLSFIEMLSISLWSIAISLATLNKNVKVISFYSIFRTILRNLAILVCLYVFGIKDELALFIGSGCSGLILIIGYFKITKKLLILNFNKTIAMDSLKIGSYLSLSNLLELFYKTSESWVLAAYQGTSALGVFTHAQFYPNYSRNLLQPAQQAAWPTIREEAKLDIPNFKKGKIMFNLINLSIIQISLFFALFGKEIIGFLSNDKFTSAAPYAAILIASSSFKHFSGRPHAATLIVYKKPKSTSLAIGLAAILGILMNFMLVPNLGIKGTLIANIINSLAFLIVLYFMGNRIKKLPNFDLTNFIGFMAITTITIINYIFNINFSLKIILLITFSFIYSYKLKIIFKKNKIIDTFVRNKIFK